MIGLNKFSSLSLPVRASIAYMVVNIVLKGWAFLSTPIFTRLMEPDQYGVVATYYAMYELVFIVATFCLQGGIFNNGMVDYPDRRDEYAFSMLALSNLISLLSLFVMLGVWVAWGDDIGLNGQFLLLMFLSYFIQPAYGFWSAKQRYEYKYKFLAVISVLMVVIATVIAIILVYYAEADQRAYARLFGYEGTLLLFYVVSYVHLARKVAFKVNTAYWKPALAFNAVLIPHYLSTYILSSSDRIMIANMVGDKEAGIYSLGYSIALVLMSVWVAINNSLIPFTYEKCKANNYASISRATMPVVILFGGCCLLLILLSPEFLFFLAPPSYYDALGLIPPIVGGIFFLSLYNVFSNIVYYHKKPRYVLIGSVASALLNIVLNFMLIPTFGYQVAAYTTLACYMLQASIDYWAMYKVVGRNIYDTRVFLGISSCVVLVSLFGTLLYEYSGIRYGMMMLALIAVARYKADIIKMVKMKS